MSANILIQTGINALLGGDAIEVLAKNATDKIVSAFQSHFTITTFEITETYQNSYNYALGAISAGLAAPEQKLAFIRKFAHAKLKREFSDPIEAFYFQPFLVQRAISSQKWSALRQQFIEKINQLAKLPPFLNSGENRRLTESELVAAIHHQESLMITDLILAQLRAQQPKLDFSLDDDNDELVAFLSFNDLLGKATLHFFLEIIRKEPRAETTFSALQREGIWADVRDIKKAQKNLSATFKLQIDELKATAMQALTDGNFAGMDEITPQLKRLQLSLDEVPQRLKAAHAAWQASHQYLIDFSQRFENWADLLNVQVEQVLEGMGQLHQDLGQLHDGIVGVDEKVVDVADEVKELKQLLLQLMGRFDLSVQVKPQDELTHYNSQSLALIQSAMAQLKGLSKNNSHDYKLVMMAGSVASSTGDLAEAENLFVEARKVAKNEANEADSALASFNLFQVRVRRGAYEAALNDLNVAISINPQRFALHDVEKYPIQKLLGAGGMGCVFLCDDEWRENQVVVKCFWQGRKGRREEVFNEVLIMRQLKCPYVPKTLGYGYVDANRQDRPYFVTEHVEGALDGEAWLAKFGKLDLQSGLEVGVQVAQGFGG
jgi:tetratricopeptide (TPR) repeat protein